MKAVKIIGIVSLCLLTLASNDRTDSAKSNEMDAALAKRRIKLTRWDWLRESVPYSYFWKHVARDAIVTTCGVFLACAWVGWMEKRRTPKGI